MRKKTKTKKREDDRQKHLDKPKTRFALFIHKNKLKTKKQLDKLKTRFALFITET